MTGDEESRGGSPSRSPDRLLPLGKGQKAGGVPAWVLSLSEEDRLLLAMELAVGFM